MLCVFTSVQLPTCSLLATRPHTSHSELTNETQGILTSYMYMSCYMCYMSSLSCALGCKVVAPRFEFEMSEVTRSFSLALSCAFDLERGNLDVAKPDLWTYVPPAGCSTGPAPGVNDAWTQPTWAEDFDDGRHTTVSSGHSRRHAMTPPGCCSLCC